MRKAFLVLALALLLGLVACGGDSAPAGDSAPGGDAPMSGEGDATAGKDLLTQGMIGTQAGCMTCHSLEPGVVGLGPSLAAAGADAVGRVEGMSAAAYLRESILLPDAYIVDGFTMGIMPVTYGDELSEEQVADLVAFLLTLQ